MYHRTLATLLASLLAFHCACSSKRTSDSSGGAPTDDKSALQKTWYAVYAENSGEYDNDPVDGQGQLTFSGDRITFTIQDEPKPNVIEGSYKLDATKSLKEIDLTMTFRGKTETDLGVYSLEGDTFHLYFATNGKPRPTELVSNPGSGIIYIRFRSNAAEAKAEVAQFKQDQTNKRGGPGNYETRAALQIQVLSQAAKAFKIKFSESPGELADLLKPPEGKPFLASQNDLLDPWQLPFRYDPTGPHNKGEEPDIWCEVPGTKPVRIIGNWTSK